MIETETAPSPVQVALLRREVTLRKRLKEVERDSRIFFYRPHPKQELFHAAARYHYRYGRTGNRFGKSEMGAAEDVAFALGYRPWYPEGHPLRTLGIPQHATKGLIITTDWDKSKEVFTEQEGENVGKLFKYIPKNCLGTPTKNHSGKIDRIPVKHTSGNWSIIRLDTVVSYKQNPLGQESGDNDWIHVDEPIPEGMWKAASRGLVDRGGRAWFTCTPLTEPWIDEEFVPDIEAQSRDQGIIANDAKSRWMMTGEMDDNPHNTPENIAMFLSWLTPDEIECRRRGIPTAYSGVVYGGFFKWEVHVRDRSLGAPNGWDSWDTPPKNYSLRLAIDYHPRKPHHVMLIATSPQDYHFVYAEVFESCLMSVLVSMIRGKLNGRELTVPGLIDPLASTPNRVTDVTALDEVLQLGLPVMPATKDPHNGILKVKEHLGQRDRVGNPTMVFNPDLPRTLMEISRGYIWDKETNKPKKDKDDAMENLYRLCLQGLDYIEPADDLDYTAFKPRDLPQNVIEPFEFAPQDAVRKEREKQRRFRQRYAI